MVVGAFGVGFVRGSLSIVVWGGVRIGEGEFVVFWMLVLELAGQQFARDSIIW